MVLIHVRVQPVINMPDEQAFARQELVTFDRLSILDEEVLLAGGVAICPEAMNLISFFDILKFDLAICSLYYGLNPTLICLAPLYMSVM